MQRLVEERTMRAAIRTCLVLSSVVFAACGGSEFDGPLGLSAKGEDSVGQGGGQLETVRFKLAPGEQNGRRVLDRLFVGQKLSVDLPARDNADWRVTYLPDAVHSEESLFHSTNTWYFDFRVDGPMQPFELQFAEVVGFDDAYESNSFSVTVQRIEDPNADYLFDAHNVAW